MRNFFSIINLAYIFIIIFVIKIFDGFLNSYMILNNNYEERMIFSSGTCDKQGYGFVKNILKKFNIKKNIEVENYNDQASSAAYFYNLDFKFDNNYIILINVTENIINQKYLKDYKILAKEDSCYFLERK